MEYIAESLSLFKYLPFLQMTLRMAFLKHQSNLEACVSSIQKGYTVQMLLECIHIYKILPIVYL